MLISRISVVASTHAALCFAVLSGCASDKGDAAPTFETDPAVLQSALELPIISCQETALDCTANAADADARGVCREELRGCLKGAADKADTAVVALDDCRTKGLDCLTNGGDLISCRPEYQACIEGAVNDPSAPAPVDDDAGVTVVPDNGNGGDTGGGSVLPSLPSVDGGILSRLPTSTKCIVELRLCVLGDPTAIQDCADTARECIKAP